MLYRWKVLDVGGPVRVARGSERGRQHQDREERDRVRRRRDGPEHGDGHQNLQARRERTVDVRKVPARGSAQSEYTYTYLIYVGTRLGGVELAHRRDQS